MRTMTRRQALECATGAVIASIISPAAAYPLNCAPDTSVEISDDLVQEVQQGDPGLPCEEIVFSPQKVLQIAWGQKKATFKSRVDQFDSRVLAAAGALVGKNRAQDRGDIARFLEVFDLPFEKGGKPLPFCAAGLSYVAATLYLDNDSREAPDIGSIRSVLGDVDHHHFYPSPSVEDMKNVAKGKRRWISRKSAKANQTYPRPGWLVVFDWDRNGWADHVGVVERANRETLHTIEFNTSDADRSNGGAISRRDRRYDETVEGFIRTDLKLLV